MKNIAFFLVGIPFGIIMTKSEVISWFRITEMFRFEALHMYGVIGVAVIVSAMAMFLFKKFRVKTWGGKEVECTNVLPFNIRRHLLAGSIFGLGWAITGACPGPMWVLVGNGFLVVLVYIAAAIVGTWTYGLVRHRLPH